MAQIFTHGYAVVIGVDQNQIQRLALPTVASDVRAVYEVLVHPERCAYDPDNVKLLKGEEATRTEILDALYWLQEKVDADPEATAVIYYSGHGMVDENAGQYYLIPYDIRSLNRIRADAIKAETFTAEIAAIRPQRMLVLLDCCHAAGVDAKAVELAADAPHLKPVSFPLELPGTKDIPVFDQGAKDVHHLATGAGRAILNSSTGAESSYIRRDGKMSLFTYHLIEALTGHAPHDSDDETVLVTDVMSYVTREVAATARDEGRQQTPVMRTTGVFPVALLLGGEGTKGIEAPPDPLAPLPQVPGMNVTFNQAGQTVGGHQVNIGEMEGDIGHIGDKIDTGGGTYVGGNVQTGGGDFVGRDRITRGDEVHGDKFTGDKVGGDKVGGDSYSFGDIEAESFAVGPGSSASKSASKGVPEPDRSESTIVQARRLEAAMPETAYVQQTTELLVMVSLLESEGLRKLLPKETVSGDIIAQDDISTAPAEIAFPGEAEPVTLHVEVMASGRDFEIEEPERTIRVFPDGDSDEETFFLNPMRPSRRAPVTVRLYDEEMRRRAIIRLAIQIEGEAEAQEGGGGELGEEIIRYALAQGKVVVNYVNTGGGSYVDGDVNAGEFTGRDREG